MRVFSSDWAPPVGERGGVVAMLDVVDLLRRVVFFGSDAADLALEEDDAAETVAEDTERSNRTKEDLKSMSV